MAEDHDPYAPPRAEVAEVSAHDYRREGKVLVMRPDSALPERCVKCNEPAILPVKERTLHWHHPAIYILILINILLYAIVALIARRKAVVPLGLCPQHQRRRRIFIAIGWGGFLLGLGAFFTGWSGDGTVGVMGLVVMLVAAVTGILGSRIAYASRITKAEVRLNGCGAAFLDSLESR